MGRPAVKNISNFVGAKDCRMKIQRVIDNKIPGRRIFLHEIGQMILDRRLSAGEN